MFDESFLNQLADAIADRLTARGLGQSRLMELPAAASYLGMTKEALRAKAIVGQIPCVKADRKFRFDKNDLDRWIENHKEAA